MVAEVLINCYKYSQIIRASVIYISASRKDCQRIYPWLLPFVTLFWELAYLGTECSHVASIIEAPTVCSKSGSIRKKANVRDFRSSWPKVVILYTRGRKKRRDGWHWQSNLKGELVNIYWENCPQ
jgi:hypothetical protein